MLCVPVCILTESHLKPNKVLPHLQFFALTGRPKVQQSHKYAKEVTTLWLMNLSRLNDHFLQVYQYNLLSGWQYLCVDTGVNLSYN